MKPGRVMFLSHCTYTHRKEDARRAWSQCSSYKQSHGPDKVSGRRPPARHWVSHNTSRLRRAYKRYFVYKCTSFNLFASDCTKLPKTSTFRSQNGTDVMEICSWGLFKFIDFFFQMEVMKAPGRNSLSKTLSPISISHELFHTNG